MGTTYVLASKLKFIVSYQEIKEHNKILTLGAFSGAFRSTVLSIFQRFIFLVSCFMKALPIDTHRHTHRCRNHNAFCIEMQKRLYISNPL